MTNRLLAREIRGRTSKRRLWWERGLENKGLRCTVKENLVLCRGVSLVHKAQWRQVPCPAIGSQHKTSQWYWEVFSLILCYLCIWVGFLFFFFTLVVWLISYGFWLCVFMKFLGVQKMWLSEPLHSFLCFFFASFFYFVLFCSVSVYFILVYFY